ncbi:SDR family oxidoreductase [Cupriavidus taiwanensis]|uniref:SDR family oxidoreductase n=1 Tax=Cupriavidus taiwanensis TaxID=164546 RepID=UPI000E1425FB|nr:SDR family oxidoreductase [Cupriavidus taiwanensis]SOY55466.1 Short chain dehydrogenase [Cupriavidus taiwanensis]
MGKTVLVTGAGSGFGKGVALGLARSGHNVIAGAQIWPQVTELRNAAELEGVQLTVIKFDVLDAIDRQRAFQHEIDVLFNNAGIMEAGPVAEIPIALVRRVFETNVFAALEVAQGFARQMIQRGSGKIVWTSSVAGLVKVPWVAAYAASKHAVEALCASMREELKPYGIQVATVNPGAYRTGFNDTGMESMDQWWEDGKQTMQPRVKRPLNNQHDPQEMIDAMIDVITAASHRYRTIKPDSAAEMVRREQADEWGVIV